MNASSATPTVNYQLRSELAQFCLPAANIDTNRKYAWANSICFLFIMIGVLGVKPPDILVRKVDTVEEVLIPVYDPPAQQEVVKQEQPPEEEQKEQTEDTPQVVQIVAADPSAAAFAVPVFGAAVAAPAHLAQAPQIRAAPRNVPAAAPSIRVFEGSGGRYPDPRYPLDAQRAKHQGTVIVYFEVDPSGKLISAEVKDSSGFPELDREALETIRRKYVFTPQDAGKFKYDFEFRLQ